MSKYSKPMPFNDPRRYQASYASRFARAERLVQARRPGKRAGTYTVARTRGVVGQTERKYYTSSRVDSAIAASTDWTGTEMDPPSINTLFIPGQDAGDTGRIGRKVDVLAIKIRGHISCAAQLNQTAADAQGKVRLILFQDMQTNAAQAQGEQLMDGSAAITGSTAAGCINTFQNLANFGRFRVLKDKTFSLSQPNMVWDGTNIEQGGITKPFKMNVKFKKPVRVSFNSTGGGTIADIVDNSFHMLAITSIIDTAPKVFYVCRVVFIDP